jgi:hypothetical protein
MRNSIKSGIIFYSMVSLVDSSTAFAEQITEIEDLKSNDILFDVFRNDLALTKSQLDKQRGGFINKNGFKISIGFEKVVVVNGKLEAKSQFFIPLNNTTEQNTDQFKGLAVAMAALQERLGQKDSDIKGNHTPDELDNVTDTLNSLTNSLSALGTSATTPQPSTFTLTTGTKSGGDNYTDALLSMLSVGQSLLDTGSVATPSTSTPQGTQLTTIENPENIPTSGPISDDLIVNSGSNNQLTATPNYSDSMTSVVMNSQDSSLIQSFQLLNIKIDNLGQYRSKSINELVLPQIIHSLR